MYRGLSTGSNRYPTWPFCPPLGLPLRSRLLLGAGFFTGLSMIIASIVKTRERFMGIGQVITQPLFFASNAIYPISIMPSWLQFIAKINPLSYMVDGLRALLVTGNTLQLSTDILILAVATFIISLISVYMYPKVVI